MLRFDVVVRSVAVLLVVSSAVVGQDAPKLPDADRWEPSIKAFEDQDQKTLPTKQANVFVGSSSIRMWKLDVSFPKLVCLNRGFGGSQLGDSVRYAEDRKSVV